MRNTLPNMLRSLRGYASFLSMLLLMLTASAVPDRVNAQSPQAGEGRPNIIYILLDDVGFADLGPYGSEIATPNIDQLAGEGIRYNHFETCAICSPTRAALLTGRNNQSVGMMDLARGNPDGPAYSRGYIPPSAATIAQILQANGYHTSAVGK